MGIKLSEIQKTLDEKMWKESKDFYDMHGFMEMCEYCKNVEKCKNGEYDYDEIFEKNTCAKAYNKMKRNI